MTKGIGRSLTLAMGLFTLAGFLGVEEGAGQILAVGGHVSVNKDITEDMTFGVGVRGQLSLPLTGMTIQGTVDFFSPDCGPLECEFQEVSLNLLWTLPVPFVATPYIGAGIAVQNTEGESALGDASDYGVNFLAGIILKGPAFQRFRPFGEVKYQMMQDFDPQMVFSGGILLVVF